jgi:hypothetical protein
MVYYFAHGLCTENKRPTRSIVMSGRPLAYCKLYGYSFLPTSGKNTTLARFLNNGRNYVPCGTPDSKLRGKFGKKSSAAKHDIFMKRSVSRSEFLLPDRSELVPNKLLLQCVRKAS